MNTLAATSVCTLAALVVTGTAAAAGPEACDAKPVKLKDRQPYTVGPYLSYLAPWNKGELAEGVDYAECLGIERSTYPDGQVIGWAWPNAAPKKNGVYNFLAVNFGNYDHTATQQRIAPRQVGEIVELKQFVDLSIDGDPQHFDVIDDFFLTSAPGDSDAKLFEVEVLLHSPSFAIRYAHSVAPIGAFAAGGRDWYATVDWRPKSTPDILVLPRGEGDVLKGAVDLKAVLDYLIEANILTGKEYFNGMGLGVEVGQGAGALAVNKLATTYR
jgi:hypothetical protein